MNLLDQTTQKNEKFKKWSNLPWRNNDLCYVCKGNRQTFLSTRKEDCEHFLEFLQGLNLAEIDNFGEEMKIKKQISDLKATIKYIDGEML